LVAHRGFEPLISWMRTRYPRPLDECAKNKTLFYGIFRYFTIMVPSI
jgi:hypothetical protein